MSRLGDRSFQEIKDLLLGLPAASLNIVVELVHATPNMGKRSAFTFGRQFERILTVLEALGLKYRLAPPQVWMEKMGCLTGGDKKVTLKKAQKLWPKLTITHSTADAMLIAAYARDSHADQAAG